MVATAFKYKTPTLFVTHKKVREGGAPLPANGVLQTTMVRVIAKGLRRCLDFTSIDSMCCMVHRA